MFKSLEHGGLEDENPCEEDANEKNVRGNKNNSEQKQNTETNSHLTKAPDMTTFHPISNDGIDDDDDDDDDDDFQASGNEVRNDPSHDMKDISYSSTQSLSEASSHDEGDVVSENREDEEDDDKDVDFISVVEDDGDDDGDNDDDDESDDDKYIKIEDEHVNTTPRSGIVSNITDTTQETIGNADDDPIKTYGVLTDDLDATGTGDDDDDGEGIYFTSESLID